MIALLSLKFYINLPKEGEGGEQSSKAAHKGTLEGEGGFAWHLTSSSTPCLPGALLQPRRLRPACSSGVPPAPEPCPCPRLHTAAKWAFS